MKVKEYTLKDLLVIKNGKDYKSLCTGKTPVYGTGGIMTYVNDKLYSGESILLPRKGTLDNIIYVNGDFWTVDTMYWSIINTKEAYPKYLYLYLSLLDLSSKDSGSTLPSMTFDSYYSVPIKLPSFDSQKEIADFIFQIHAKIDINNKINIVSESVVKTLYDYWFLQFDFPNEEGKPYKSSGGKMVWNTELKRDIPEGWGAENLMNSSLCEDIKAGVDYFETKKYLPTANVNGENITDGENISFDNRENRANMQPIKNSVWFAKMKNSIKHLTIPKSSDWFTDKYILSTGFQGFKCNKYSLSLVHCIVNSNWFENYKDILSHGATQEGVNNEDLKNIKFPVPTGQTLYTFSKIVQPLLERKFSIIRENQELTSLRDFLLPLLMNGQVTVR